ncbi:MAG: FecR domain-containing protein [Bdellovibrionota bacterium]|nr:FecR domain-containing protein [Bdellovibrionota bacterium]
MKAIVVVGLTMAICNASQAALTAKVLLVKGDVTKLSPGEMQASAVKKGDLLVEDTSIVTKDKSFVRLKFSDHSTMNVAPKSMAVISKLPKEKASVVKLLNGIVKAQVDKNIKLKTKTKLIVKTPNAVLGVRGTKFQSIFNPKNKTTSLITVEGEVAMAKSKAEPLKEVEVDTLDKTFENPKEVIEVPAGKYTGVSETIEKPIEPVKIAPEQYNAIAKSMGSKKTAEEVMKTSGSSEVEAAKNSAIKSGGYVDFNTGLYVPPPASAKLDEKTGTYEAPKLGKIDKNTGDFIPPKGVKVDDKKGLIIDKKEFAKVASSAEKEKLLAAVVEVKKSEKAVPLVVNKSKAQKKPSKPFSWGPKNHLLTAKFVPYSEALKIKNRNNGAEANVFSDRANTIIFTWQHDWSEKFSTRLRIGDTEYHIDEDDVSVQNYGNDTNGGYFSFGTIYRFNDRLALSADIVDTRAFYAIASNQGAGSSSVNFRSNDLQTIEFGVKYLITKYESFNLHALGNIEFGLDPNVPTEFDDAGGDHSGISAGLEMQWMWTKTLGVFPSVVYRRTETDNDDYKFYRQSLHYGLDFIWDI